MDFVETMSHILLLARSMGGVPPQSESPQIGRDQDTEELQGGSEFILIPNAQEQGAELLELGEIPIEGMSRE